MLGAPVVPGGNAPPVLEPAEHDLDAVATFVPAFVVLDGLLALLSTWDAGAYPFVFQRFSDPIGVIARIPEQPFDIGQAAHQWPRADVIADLSGSDKEIDWTSLAVTHGMQFGVHAGVVAKLGLWRIHFANPWR